MIEKWCPIEDDPYAPAALAALGFVVKPKVHLYEGRPTQQAHRKASWLVSVASSDGKHDIGLYGAWREGILPSTSPNHPFTVAVMALQTRAIIKQGRPHVIKLTGNNICRAVTASTRTQGADVAQFLPAGHILMDADHAAAAVVCGFACYGPEQGKIRISNTGVFSRTLTASKLAAVAASIATNPASCTTTAIDGAAPGEHPFLYALAAIMQARALQQAAEQMDPTMHLNSRSGAKVALVSQSIMDGPNPFKDHVHHHIKA